MRKLLVAYDGEKPGLRAIEVAVELAGAFDAEILVCSVVPDSPAPTPPWDNEAVHTRLVADARDAFARHGLMAGTIVAHGDPVTEIGRLAADNECDTIVVGAHTIPHTSGVESSVSAQVALRAPVPVVVVAH
jgi:nucleotide-binding universal stress UspA family protein